MRQKKAVNTLEWVRSIKSGLSWKECACMGYVISETSTFFQLSQMFVERIFFMCNLIALEIFIKNNDAFVGSPKKLWAKHLLGVSKACI